MPVNYITPSQLEKAVVQVENKIPSKEIDPYYITEQIIITSHEELKPYIVLENDNAIYVDFKGKNVFIEIIADDEHWIKDVDDGWKYLHIIGQLYSGMYDIQSIKNVMYLDDLGVVFGFNYGGSSSVVITCFTEEHVSNICVIDRLVSCRQEY